MISLCSYMISDYYDRVRTLFENHAEVDVNKQNDAADTALIIAADIGKMNTKRMEIWKRIFRVRSIVRRENLNSTFF